MVEVGFGDEYMLHQVLQLSAFDYVISLKSFHYLLLMINRDGVSGLDGWAGWDGWYYGWYDVMLICVMLRDTAWCCVVLRDAAWCCVMLRNAALRCVALRCVYIVCWNSAVNDI